MDTSTRTIKTTCLAAFLILLVSCNIPTEDGNPTTRFSVEATLTPVPTAEFTEADVVELSNYFAEEFDSGLPESWEILQRWNVTGSILQTRIKGAQFIVPGVWQDMTLITRFRIARGGEIVILFNNSDSGMYQISLSANGASADWFPEGAEPEPLAQSDHPIQEGWHNLFIRSTYGNVTVLIDDDPPLLKFFNATVSPKGSIGVINRGSGLLEIDRIVIAPPGMGPR